MSAAIRSTNRSTARPADSSGASVAYRPVVFLDTSTGASFLTRSTVSTHDEVVWEDGRTYPLYKAEVTDQSHPYFTGQRKIVDTAGRVERFTRRYGDRRRRS